MSNQVFPTLAGQGWEVARKPTFKTRKQQSVSGKVTRIADWVAPIWHWTLTFDVLRQGSINGHVFAELAQVQGFYLQMLGGFDSFLFRDDFDNAVTNQQIGIGNGTTRTFQLNRTWGGFVEPVFAPNVVSQVFVNGVLQPPANYTLVAWPGAGASLPGTITFNVAPPAGQAVTVNMSYYWPCSFEEDEMETAEFSSGFFALKKLAFLSIKF